MRITGTFLDEITHDIPSNNWSTEEWAKDFKVVKAIGIDTVILIRTGVGRIAADWRKLWWKMRAAQAVGVEKLITFEFSHFLSPNSCWPAAKNLFKRYCEHFGIDMT